MGAPSDLRRQKSLLQSFVDTFRSATSPTSTTSATVISPSTSMQFTATSPAADSARPAYISSPAIPTMAGAPSSAVKQVERTPSEASNVSLQSAVSAVYEGDDGARDSHHGIAGSKSPALGSSLSCPSMTISPSPSPRLPQRLASLTPPNTPPMEASTPAPVTPTPTPSTPSSSGTTAFGLDFKKITDFFTLFTSKSTPSLGSQTSATASATSGKKGKKPEPVITEQAASASAKAPQEFVKHIFDEHKTSHAILYSRYDDPYENETAANPLAKDILPKPRNTSYRWYPNVPQMRTKNEVSSPMVESFSLDLAQPLTTPSSTFRANAPEFLKKFNIEERREPTTGDVIGNYRLGEVIGIGAFSSVRVGTLVQDPTVKVAIKVSEIDACDESRLAQMRKELSLWGTWDHPNLVKLLDHIETSSHTFTVCELCDEGSMYDLVINTPEGFLSEDEAKPYFVQIMQALLYLHSRATFHGDVKLDNILVTKTGNVKLCDFGFCECIKDRDQSFEGRSCGGTLLYCAPEVLRGGSEVGLPSDIWSAGVTLFAMLTGELPFDDDYEPRLKHQILSGKFCFPPDIELSQPVQSLITMMLKTKASERPTVQEVLAHEWFRGVI